MCPSFDPSVGRCRCLELADADDEELELMLMLVPSRAGSDVDGQVLVLHDMLGMTHEFNPRFLRRYLNLYDDIGTAIKQYDKDVKNKKFPDNSEEY